MDLLLANKVIALVGGTSGMGFAAAEILATEGAQLALIGRELKVAQAKAAALSARFSVHVIGLAADERASDPLVSAIDQAASAFGGLDGLAVTAGPMGALARFSELIAFMLSARAAYMTGATVNIDGGTDF